MAERTQAGQDYGFQNRAIRLLTQPGVRRAFDLSLEPVRERRARLNLVTVLRAGHCVYDAGW
jgi:hypothetical protein